MIKKSVLLVDYNKIHQRLHLITPMIKKHQAQLVFTDDYMLIHTGQPYTEDDVSYDIYSAMITDIYEEDFSYDVYKHSVRVENMIHQMDHEYDKIKKPYSIDSDEIDLLTHTVITPDKDLIYHKLETLVKAFTDAADNDEYMIQFTDRYDRDDISTAIPTKVCDMFYKVIEENYTIINRNRYGTTHIFIIEQRRQKT